MWCAPALPSSTALPVGNSLAKQDDWLWLPFCVYCLLLLQLSTAHFRALPTLRQVNWSPSLYHNRHDCTATYVISLLLIDCPLLLLLSIGVLLRGLCFPKADADFFSLWRIELLVRTFLRTVAYLWACVNHWENKTDSFAVWFP